MRSDELVEQATRWAAILNSSGDDDDVCDGQLLDALLDRIERLTAQLAEARESERAAVVAWLWDDAAKTADDLRRLHAKKKLTPMMTEGWKAVIRTKGGVAFAIEAGEHLA